MNFSKLSSAFLLTGGITAVHLCLLAGCATKSVEPQKIQTGKYYIDNGRVRLGVDLDRGGSVFYFAQSSTQQSLLNHADEGRFIQQSYYGEPDGSVWWNQNWVWNPIQGGGSKGDKAKIRSHKLGKTFLDIISEPVHWAYSTNMAELEMEAQIKLVKDVAHIHYIFRNTGETATNHPSAHHELPAVFVDANYPNLHYYNGDAPWTGAGTTNYIPGWPNQYQKRTEEWSAYLNDSEWGIGVYTPGSYDITCYRFEGDGKKGPEGSACSYFAPLRQFSIEKGMTFEYDVYLRIGTRKEIRDSFYKIHKKMK